MPEDKIQRLMEKEERIKESANLASWRRTPHKTPHRRHSDVSMKDASDTPVSPSKMCYLCKGENFQRHYSYVVDIQNFAERLRLKREKKVTRPNRSSSSCKGKGSTSKKPREKKSYGYSAQNDDSGSSFEDSDPDNPVGSQDEIFDNEGPCYSVL